MSDIGSAYGANKSQGSAAKSRHSGIAAGIGQLDAPKDKIKVNDQKESTMTRNDAKPFDAYLQGGALPEANKTGQNFGHKAGIMTNAPNNNYLNNPDIGSENSGGPKQHNRNFAAKTIDPEEDKASNYENVSAGGTRYIVGLKGNLKFYGANSNSQADINESLSAYSRSRGGGPLAELADSLSKGNKDENYDNHSMEDGSIDKSEHDPRLKGVAYQDDNNSMHSIPRNAEIGDRGFPINGPGEEGDRSAKHHGKKKKKKRKDLRPNTSQQYGDVVGIN